jgi:D-glycero-D-manno-heptose 1,7-bisphosphate phosphatase
MVVNGAPAVFFDRDGVLIRDGHYLSDPDKVEWVSGAKSAISLLKARGFLLFVVTNQSGVARGYFDEASVRRVHDRLQADLAGHGAIDEFVYCPHLRTGTVDAYRIDCDCRKPKPGMILRLIEAWSCDPTSSFMIGDKVSDMEAAAAAGLNGYLFDGAESGADLGQFVADILAQRGSVPAGRKESA